MIPPNNTNPESIRDRSDFVQDSFRRRVAEMYTTLVPDGVLPLFEGADNNKLFETIRQNIDRTDAMRGLPEGYGEASMQRRLTGLSQMRIVLPKNNEDNQADAHNKTIENYTKLALLTAQDIDTAMVHIATLLAVMNEGDLTEHLAWQLIFMWAPFADIIGMKDVKRYFEKSAFYTLEPEEYMRIDSEMNELLGLESGSDYESREAVLEAEGAALEHYLNERLQGYEIWVSVSTRVKSNFSVWQKQSDSGCSGSPVKDTIFDYLGFRIVVDTYDKSQDHVRDACLLVESIVCGLFQPRPEWRLDYGLPKLQSSYKGIHNTCILPDGLFAQGTVAEFQVRSVEEHKKLEDDEKKYSDYSARKSVPGKKPSTHVKRAKHHIYDWRARAAARLSKKTTIDVADILQEEVRKTVGKEQWIEVKRSILVFDKKANLHAVGADETVLDVLFRIHSDKAFRMQRIFSGRGEIDDEGKITGLIPINITKPVTHGMRLVVIYNPKGQEIVHDGWRDIARWPDAIKRVDKKIKERDEDISIRNGEERVKEAIEAEGLGANHYYGLTANDWEVLCRKYGLTRPRNSSLSYQELLLRDIGHRGKHSPKPNTVVSYIKTKIELLHQALPVELTLEEPSAHEALQGVALDDHLAVRAKCCSKMEFDGRAYAIVSRTSGTPMLRLHNCQCKNIAGLVDSNDPRLILVSI